MEQSWMLGPFHRVFDKPILVPDPKAFFMCPCREEKVFWQAKDVFNPASVVFNDKLYLLFRAEDTVGKYSGTSRIGIAESDDGFNFRVHPEPVLFPDPADHMYQYEWEGGCEDPRVVQRNDGIFVMTYTAYDGRTARLCVATSFDLFHWQKIGLAFPEEDASRWTKSGSIVCRVDGPNYSFIAQRIPFGENRYWMFFGEGQIHCATSEDLLHWTPDWNRVALPRRYYSFDNSLVEAGPPAVLTRAGTILMLYNSRRDNGTYSVGQCMWDERDPTVVVARCMRPCLEPIDAFEIQGQVGKVVFAEGLSVFRGKTFLYYGCADSSISVAQSSSPWPFSDMA